MSHVSPNYRSPVTLGDFVQSRRSRGNKHSPENSNYQHHRQVPDHKTLFQQDSSIDFSVNDIQFEKVQKKNRAAKELKWSENDVDFTVEAKTCSYKNCLTNDENVNPFNNFHVPSTTYSSVDSDINFNNEHFFLPDAQEFDGYSEDPTSVSYFPFDRVEEDEMCLGLYHQGTTYYNIEDQVWNMMDNVTDSLGSLDLDISSTISVPENETTNNKSLSHLEDIEKDEELNNLVLSIIDS